MVFNADVLKAFRATDQGSDAFFGMPSAISAMMVRNERLERVTNGQMGMTIVSELPGQTQGMDLVVPLAGQDAITWGNQ